MLLAISLLSLMTPLELSALSTMKVAYSWTTVDLLFPSESERQNYISTGQFIPENNIITDVDVWKGDGGQKVFVALAKFAEGSPVTLATVSNQTRDGNPLLEPYPDWSWQANCDGIYSVYRVKVDSCNRLWVLDSGIYEDSELVCPPQIVVFDLETNNLIRRHRFPSSILSCDSNLITIVVEVLGGNCSNSVAYIADVAAFKLIVYDLVTDSSWQVTNSYFYPNPFYGNFQIDGIDLDFMDGVFGLALGPECENQDRKLYFHSLSSVNEFWVNTSVLRNMSIYVNNTSGPRESFHVLSGTRQSQSSVQDMTRYGILFYGLVAENAIGVWNSSTPFNKENIFIGEKDDNILQFPSGLKVVDDELWVVSNRLQNFFYGEVPLNETNYHIVFGKVDDILKNAQRRSHYCGLQNLISNANED